MDFAVGPSGEGFEVRAESGFGGESGDATEIGGDFLVEKVEAFGVFEWERLARVGLEAIENFFEFRPERLFGGEESREINDHRSEELTLFDIGVLSDDLSWESGGVELSEANPLALKFFGEFAEAVPLEMASEVGIDLVEFLDGGGEEGVSVGGLEHIDDEEVLSAEEGSGFEEIFGEDGVIESGEKNDEGALAEILTEEDGEFLEVWGNILWVKGIELISAGVVVSLAAFGADEAMDAVTKSDETEEIALLFGGEAENE